MKNIQNVREGSLYIMGGGRSRATRPGFLKRAILTETEELLTLTEMQEGSRQEACPVVGMPPISAITFEVKIDYRTMLLLLYGCEGTNNWLKMHGGIMKRNGGKRKRESEGRRKRRRKSDRKKICIYA